MSEQTETQENGNALPGIIGGAAVGGAAGYGAYVQQTGSNIRKAVTEGGKVNPAFAEAVNKLPEAEKLKDALGILANKEGVEKEVLNAAKKDSKEAIAAIRKGLPKEMNAMKSLGKGGYAIITAGVVAGIAVGAMAMNAMFGGKHSSKVAQEAQMEPAAAAGRA